MNLITLLTRALEYGDPVHIEIVFCTYYPGIEIARCWCRYLLYSIEEGIRDNPWANYVQKDQFYKYITCAHTIEIIAYYEKPIETKESDYHCPKLVHKCLKDHYRIRIK